MNIDARYTPLKQIGTGAYGVVVAARDELTGERVAVKKVSNAFRCARVGGWPEKSAMYGAANIPGACDEAPAARREE